jgi:hypothetical protein
VQYYFICTTFAIVYSGLFILDHLFGAQLVVIRDPVISDFPQMLLGLLGVFPGGEHRRPRIITGLRTRAVFQPATDSRSASISSNENP